jgi:uncharacterized membrane protein
MTITLAAWLVSMGLIALLRRWWYSNALSPNNTPPVLHPLNWWNNLNLRYKLISLGLGLVVVLILVFAGIVFLLPKPAERLTEFYALGPTGLAEGYARKVTPGQEMEVKLGIVNQESVSGQYLVQVLNEGKILTQLGPIMLAPQEKWEQPLRYSLAKVGDNQKIDFLLFYNDKAAPYRQLHLWVNVG